jgi:2-methylcitrate dehydratase PrpD
MLGILAGYETVSRIGAAAPAEIVDRRFRPLAIMGPFGAAAAAAVVRGLPGPQIAAALSIASNLAGGSTQGIFEGTMEPYFQAGAAARNGLLAAQLAAAGAVTSEESLEGEFGFFATYGGQPGDLEELLGPREQAGVDRVGSKRFAACLQNQETMALISDQLPVPLRPDEIGRVILTRPARGTHGLNSPGVSRVPPFANMLQAQMSARFTLAAALLGRPVEDPRFFQRSYGDPDLTALAGRIELVPTDQTEIRVEIERTEGAPVVLSSFGSDVLFPSDEEIRSRFLTSAVPAIAERADAIVAVVDKLEAVADIRELTGLLSSAEERS